MAPPPDSAAGVRSPCWRRAIHRTKGRASATSARARPANRSQDRQAVSRFSSQAGNQARPIVLLHQPQGDGLSPINPSPPLPAIGTGRPLSTYSLPIRRAAICVRPHLWLAADQPVLASWRRRAGGRGGLVRLTGPPADVLRHARWRGEAVPGDEPGKPVWLAELQAVPVGQRHDAGDLPQPGGGEVG